ncbi:MAG: Xaa-Pro peptidase family protein [Candidatus Saccharibacteria bacterium]|nr:Xaa-Pro peptidase family protein [Candidatus Saccharibacteria bacterium]
MTNFNSDFFSNNRQKLIQVLPNSLIVIAGHVSFQMSADTAFPFRQDSNFWYLTGINEPDCVLVLDTRKGKSILVIPELNDYQKEWDGDRDYLEIEKVSGIELIQPRRTLNSILTEAKKSGQQICYIKPAPERVEPYGFYSNPARRLLETEIKQVESEPKDVRIEIARLRQIKQPVEIEALQTAIDVTGATLADVKANLQKFKTEKELERAISSGFFTNGADGHGYEPIIGSGINASVLHYNKNADILHNNALVLLDVGAIFGGYSADISRAWSVGKLSDRQREVYDAVCELQDKAFSMLGPGVKIREYQIEMEKHAFKKLKQIGIKLDQYPHGFSHFLGLDVHDAGDYEAPLLPNSVITVEPGIYLSDEGIGVRIEDDILITENGIKNLSKHIPRML